MPRFEEAKDLVSVGPDALGRDTLLTPATARAWTELHRAAAADGVQLLLLSGFRSLAYQAGIVRRKLEAGQTLDAILRISAYPGHSEHHTGTVIDLGAPEAEHLSEAFAQTGAFAWLDHHAESFGFHLSYPRDNPHGIAYEPWHWRHTARSESRLQAEIDACSSA